MASHPPSTTAPAGADPVKDLTDGAKQLEINQKENAAAGAQKQPKAQQAKKENNPKGGAAEGGSSRPVEVSRLGGSQ